MTIMTWIKIYAAVQSMTLLSIWTMYLSDTSHIDLVIGQTPASCCVVLLLIVVLAPGLLTLTKQIGHFWAETFQINGKYNKDGL